METNIKQLGLVGRVLNHSFSQNYFQKKFKREGIIGWQFSNFPLKDINDFRMLLGQLPNLKGLSVTIPYKESIIKFLDSLSPVAEKIGAVNTIVFEDGKLIGYNTDVIGFQNSIYPLIEKHHEKALVLGSGGASKAVVFALNNLKIDYLIVSRNPKNDKEISYSNINNDLLSTYKIIINTTPLGMFPNVSSKPDIPYDFLNRNNLLFDLVYNPAETEFLRIGKNMGCITKNGLEMLKIQAEEAWKLWNS